MSGFFGNVLGQLGGLMGGQSGAHEGAGSLLGEALSAAGGPAGILQKFQQAGLGEKAESWIGSGHNLPVSAEQIEQVFPPAQLDALAQRAGLPAGIASQVLAEFLPHAVDHSTPDGTVTPAAPVDPQVPADASAPAADGSKFDFAGMISRLANSK